MKLQTRYKLCMFKAIKKIAWTSWVFAHLPQQYHRKSSITPQICNQLQPVFRANLSSKNVTFWLSCQNNWACFAFVIGMLHVSCFFLFLINFKRQMYSVYVWNLIEQSKPLQTRYDTTYIYARYYIRTHVSVFLLSVKKRVFELSRVWPWRWPHGGTPYMVLIGPVFH